MSALVRRCKAPKAEGIYLNEAVSQNVSKTAKPIAKSYVVPLILIGLTACGHFEGSNIHPMRVR